jgi:hypothetical protein
MTDDLWALADRQWHDYRARRPGTCFADPGFALDLACAYELQDAVAALRIATGDRVIGYLRDPQRAPADQTGAEERRKRYIAASLTERKCKSRIRDRRRRIAAIAGVAGKRRVIA